MQSYNFSQLSPVGLSSHWWQGSHGGVCAHKAGQIPPPGGAGEDPSATVQPFAPTHKAARHLSGIRVLLEARSARRATRHAACQRLAEWIKQHRHLPGRECFQRLHARRRGHYNSYGVRGNARSLTRFFHGAMDCMFQWRNRRGSKQSSDTWEQFPQVLDRVKRARPRITEVPRRRVFA